MKQQPPEKFRITTGQLATKPGSGMSGAFMFKITSPAGKHKIGATLFAIVSDGMGWEHVSVSVMGFKRCPTWEEMALVKDLFWDETEAVMQLHPAKADHINVHPFTLHLWKPSYNPPFFIEKIPLPPKEMV